MPYKVVEKKGKFHVVNKETGEDKGASESREKAVAHMRLLYGVGHGMKSQSNQKR